MAANLAAMPESRLRLFDYSARNRARARAARLQGDRFLDIAAAGGIADRLGAVKRQFLKGMMLDVPEIAQEQLFKFAQHWTFASLGECESVPLKAEKFDLIVSVNELQVVNDLPGVLIQINRALIPDGLFMASLLGGHTLSELRESFAHAETATRGGISPRVAPFADVRDLGALLQRGGFALPVADVERLTVLYRDFFSLARDLRAHGLTNAMSERSKQFLRRDTLGGLLEHYAQHHGENGKLRARFETLYLTGWASHQSQQQPLKPGSAKTRLAEALGAVEHPLKR
jgi:SAM-dependent methyltransferase